MYLNVWPTNCPERFLIKHKDKLREIEALLFGQAGFLSEDREDEYARTLSQTYAFLKKKYNLKPLDHHLWKFMRMRPANFPTIRLAQFAVLIFKSSHMFSKMLAAKNYKEIRFLFSSEVSSYWKKHYVFDRETTEKSKKLGKTSIELIIINTVIPFLFHYGQIQSEERFKNKALALLEELPAEKNKITKGFEKLGFKVENAFQSQALIQLKTKYCDEKKCLSCAIGNSIVGTPLEP